jgi:hypothetical protein
MAKKRRKPHSRPRTSPSPGGAVRTAERPESADRNGEGDQQDGARAATRPPSSGQRSRAEKKELARRQREEARRRVRRVQRLRQLVWITGFGAMISLAVLWFVRSDEPAVRPERLPGELRSEAPWPANAAQAAERSDLIGLPAEGTTMHEHANVQVFVNGEQQSVPTDIGINREADPPEVLSLHTHEGSGTVHMESQSIYPFTLGEFFDVWGVRLSDSCLGAYCEEGESSLRVFESGVELDGPIRDVRLLDRTVYVIAFGTEDEVPDPVPSAFDFDSVPQ